MLSQQERDALFERNPLNVVSMTLPEGEADDRSKFVKYARSAQRLQLYRDQGQLSLEPKPALYRYTQHFSIPGAGDVLERTALIVLIKVEPYENGVVLPHEQTFPKHKEDRLRILEATRAHLECIYGLFEDQGGSVFSKIHDAPAEKVADVTPDDGIRHILERIDDPASTEALAEALKDKKVWIADGHHRYETAVKFRENLGAREGEVAEDYMMMALSSIADPGLVLLPTHRILKKGPEDLVSRLRVEDWQIEEAPNAELMARIEAIAAEGLRAFGVALPGGKGLILRINDLAAVVGRIETHASEQLKALDVTILHERIFAQLLGLTGHDFFGYTRDPKEAVDAVEQGSPAAFLMNPPTVDDMRVIALGGEKMPQKSTYYYPKLLSGLVLWSLKDF